MNIGSAVGRGVPHALKSNTCEPIYIFRKAVNSCIVASIGGVYSEYLPLSSIVSYISGVYGKINGESRQTYHLRGVLMSFICFESGVSLPISLAWVDG